MMISLLRAATVPFSTDVRRSRISSAIMATMGVLPTGSALSEGNSAYKHTDVAMAELTARIIGTPA